MTETISLLSHIRHHITDLLFPPNPPFTKKTTNMAAQSIAAELLSLASDINYVSAITCFDTDDFIPLNEFRKTALGNVFVINRENCIVNNHINNNHLFQMFGKYSDEEPDAVRSDTIERLHMGAQVYTAVGADFFTRMNTNFREWALTACSQYYYGDEMLLFVLCRIFHRHAIVVCRERYWYTGEFPEEMCIDEILARCDLHLVYIRPGIFGELKLKKKYGDTIPLISPPEFPAWSTDVNTSTAENSMLENSSANLLSTFLNIYPETGISNLTNGCDSSMIINAGNAVSTNDIIGGNVVPTQATPTEDNTTITNSTWMDNTQNGEKLHRNEAILSDEVILTGSNRLNPIKLKENCIYTIANSIKNGKPPFLMELCADAMSWSPHISYRCNLTLPKTASTQHIKFKLKRMNAYPHVFGYPRKLTPRYEDVRVDKTYKDLVLRDLKTWKYTVILNRISETTIAKWQPPHKESWELIDPYLSLEEVGDTTSDETDREALENIATMNTVNPPNDPVCNVVVSYNLRERSSRRYNPRPSRLNSLNIDYNVDIPFKDVPPSPARPWKRHKPIPQGPSIEKMSAQGKHTKAPTISHPIKHKILLKAETSESENEEPV